jgi:hypothetical protein
VASRPIQYASRYMLSASYESWSASRNGPSSMYGHVLSASRNATISVSVMSVMSFCMPVAPNPAAFASDRNQPTPALTLWAQPTG